MSSSSVSAVFAPSGQSLILYTQDSGGNPSNVTSMSTANEVQSISLTGAPLPLAATIPLTFGGQTVNIPVTVNEPANYALWTFPTIAGHSYDLASTFLIYQEPTIDRYYFEVIDGGAVVHTQVLETAASGPGAALPGFNDPGVNSPNSTPIPWATIASAIVASGTTLQVRITAESLSLPGSIQPISFLVDALRVKDNTASSISYYDDADSSKFQAVSPFGTSHVTDPTTYNGGYTTIFYDSGFGPLISITGGAAALQAALQGLSSIGSGNVTVTELTQKVGGFTVSSSSYAVTFMGSLSNVSHPLITSTDPSVAIVETNAGGQFPVLRKNGSPLLSLTSPIYTASSASNPFVMYLLPQSAPQVQTILANDPPFTVTGPGDAAFVADGTAFSGATYFIYNDNATSMSFPFTVTPGTYTLAATWSTASVTGFGRAFTPCTASPFSVTNTNGAVTNLTVDQTKAPADFTYSGSGFKSFGSFTTTVSGTITLTLTGVTGVGLEAVVMSGAQLTRTSADQSITVPDSTSDVYTLDLPNNLIHCQAGSIAGVNGMPIALPSPTAILPAFNSTPKSMRIGYNNLFPAYYDDFIIFSNLATNLYAGCGAPASDANGYPTKLTASRDGNNKVVLPVTLDALISLGENPGGGNSRYANFNIPSGLYRMHWDGNPNHILVTAGENTCDLVSSTPGPGGIGNEAIYNVQVSPALAYSPGIKIRFQSTTPDPSDSTGNTYLCSINNLAVYPPDPSDPTGNTAWVGTIPKFHPSYVYKGQGVQCKRNVDTVSTNNQPFSLYSHLKTDSALSRAGSTKTVTVNVSQIKEPTAGKYFIAPTHTIVQITTSTPHGFFSGAIVNLSGVGTATFSNGTSFDLAQQLVAGPIQVLDSTNFLWVGYTGDSSATMTNVLSGGTATCNIGAFWTLQDFIDDSLACGANELWFPFPVTIDLSVGGGADQIFAYFAANTPPGFKLHAEFGNECWNSGSPVFLWCSLQNALITGTYDYSYETYYANQQAALNARGKAVYGAAGRAADLIRTWAGLGAAGNIAGAIATRAQALGATMDEFAVSCYYANSSFVAPLEPSQYPLFDSMTTLQQLDFLKLNLRFGQYETIVTSIQKALAGSGYAGVPVVFYEFGPNTLVAGNYVGGQPPGGIPNYYLRNNAVKRHPDIYGAMLYFFEKFQDLGVPLLNCYNMGGETTPFDWNVYESINQQRGTGSVTAESINVTNPQAKGLVYSEIGGAVHTWAGLVAQTPVTPTKKHLVPGHNGQLKAIGFPRGTNSLTR